MTTKIVNENLYGDNAIKLSDEVIAMIESAPVVKKELLLIEDEPNRIKRWVRKCLYNIKNR